MTARELAALLATVDPEAVIIPGHGKFSHWRATFTSARASRAQMKTKAPWGTKYLEMPESGDTKVVVIE